MMDDKLQAALWCVFKIIKNRERRQNVDYEKALSRLVAEMNYVLELSVILATDC